MANRLISTGLTFACLALAVVLWMRRSPGVHPTNAAPSLLNSTAVEDEALLDQKIVEIRWDNITLDDALVSLADLSKVNISANWRTLAGGGILRTDKVRIHLRNVTLRQALDALLANIIGKPGQPPAYFVDHGVVTLTTAEDAGPNTVTEMINMRPLLDEMWRAWQRAPGPDSRLGATGPRAEEPVDALTRYITDTAAPDSWRDAGGTIGSIREMAGVFIITQTPENLAEIRRVLMRYRQVLHATGFPPLPATVPASTQPAGR